MQNAFEAFTKTDLARYPFLKKTGQYVKEIDLDMADLEDGMLVKRAEERVGEAITSVRITRNLKPTLLDTEIASYPVSLLLVAATENSFIRKRYALAEAKQAAYDLASEKDKDRVAAVAEQFGWQLSSSPKQGVLPHDFSLHFTDYVRNITHLQTDKKWKLINRIIVGGIVYLNQGDVARLLEEEIRKDIEKRLESTTLAKLPAPIVEAAERLNKLAAEKAGTAEMEGFPKIVLKEAFPPCINALCEAASKSHHLSHVGRFTLTSFLVTIGMAPEQVAEVFKTFSDYNARLTRYQVEHIAGERGSGTKYTPPSCSTLQTHGVCTNSDSLCRRIHHPLAYYRIKHGSAR